MTCHSHVHQVQLLTTDSIQKLSKENLLTIDTNEKPSTSKYNFNS